MKDKVAAYIRKHHLLERDGLHVVALSGGADSVALLLILRDLGYQIEAAHCNFHLRGDESNRDEDFVKKLCQNLNIPLHVIHFDTDEYASVHQVSIEMAARELRYGYFRQLCQDIGAVSVCVAHHRDDAVETFLMNLLRGSGVHGLTGIRPKNGHIIRPLLCVSRQEIVDFLDSIGQAYVTDSTNLEANVLRNRIRLQVMPLLKELNPHAAENICKTARFIGDAEKIMDAWMQEVTVRLVKDGKVRMSELLQLPSPETFLHEWLAPFGFNTAQTAQIADLLNGCESGRVFCTHTHTLLIDRDELILESVSKPMKLMKIPESGRYRYDENLLFDIKISDTALVSKVADCMTVDASDIHFPLTIRPVQPGDSFSPFGMEGRKLVSDFLTDCKLSLLQKRRQLVITQANGDILWLVGLRTDNRYRVTKATKTTLRIQIISC